MYKRIIRKSYKEISHEFRGDKLVVKVEMSPFDRFCQPVRMTCTKEEVLDWLKANNILPGDIVTGYNLNNVNHKLCSGKFVFKIPPKQKKIKKVLDKDSECVIMDREEVEVPVATKTKTGRKRRKPTTKTHKLLGDEDVDGVLV